MDGLVGVAKTEWGGTGSPSQTPMDVFLWGVLRDRVDGSKPTTIEEQRVAVTNDFHRIDQQKKKKRASGPKCL